MTEKRGMDWWYGMVVSLVGLVSNFACEIEQGRFCFLRAEFAWTTFIIQGHLSATDRLMRE